MSFIPKLTHIERELRHYKHHLKTKQFFATVTTVEELVISSLLLDKIEDLGLKRLITTCYKTKKTDLFSEHKSESAIGFNIMATKMEQSS